MSAMLRWSSHTSTWKQPNTAQSLKLKTPPSLEPLEAVKKIICHTRVRKHLNRLLLVCSTDFFWISGFSDWFLQCLLFRHFIVFVSFYSLQTAVPTSPRHHINQSNSCSNVTKPSCHPITVHLHGWLESSAQPFRQCLGPWQRGAVVRERC